MRRSRAPLSAWPAFADVMTILAVVSLAVAAFALSGKDPELIKTLKRKLKQAEETIQEQEIRIRELKWAQIGRPCLWDPGPPTRVFPLLRITVTAQYEVALLQSLERGEIRSIPELENAVDQSDMGVQEFKLYANAIYKHGLRDDTFGQSCRFYVELIYGGADPRAYSHAVGVVNQYFLYSNSAAVNKTLEGLNRILTGEQ
ncbi:MAG: hypothetical protein OXC19_06030 [Bryobacterales bacterium]|nr:hypothetical protein [Bryobacterales bacterium]